MSQSHLFVSLTPLSSSLLTNYHLTPCWLTTVSVHNSYFSFLSRRDLNFWSLVLTSFEHQSWLYYSCFQYLFRSVSDHFKRLMCWCHNFNWQDHLEVRTDIFILQSWNNKIFSRHFLPIPRWIWMIMEVSC